MSWPAKHPGPWRCEFDEDWPAITDQPILDANGEPVVITDSGCYPPDPETARAIVDAMNGRAALLAERDRLRDLASKMAGKLAVFNAGYRLMLRVQADADMAELCDSVDALLREAAAPREEVRT